MKELDLVYPPVTISHNKASNNQCSIKIKDDHIGSVWGKPEMSISSPFDTAHKLAHIRHNGEIIATFWNVTIIEVK